MRKISSSGNPVIAPTLSNASGDPPCASITRFAVSTTKRTLSVSVPSRSHSTAPMRAGRLTTAAARRENGSSGLDREHGLLRDAAIARVLPEPHETLELVVQLVRVL